MPAQKYFLRRTLLLFCICMLLMPAGTVLGQERRKATAAPPLIVQTVETQPLSAEPLQTDLDSVASISGRISDAYGRGIRGAVLLIFDMQGNPPQIARSNMFGFYRFDGLATGEDYIVTVLHGKYFFVNNSRYVTLTGSMANMNFQADEQ